MNMFNNNRMYPLPGEWDKVGNMLVSYDHYLFLIEIDGRFILEDFHGHKEVFDNKDNLVERLMEYERK